MITGYLTLFHASIGLRPKISTRSLGERSSGGSPGTSHRSIPCRHKTAPATSHRAALSRTPPSPFPTTPARLRGPCPARSRHGILPLGRHRRGNSRSLRQGAGGSRSGLRDRGSSLSQLPHQRSAGGRVVWRQTVSGPVLFAAPLRDSASSTPTPVSTTQRSTLRSWEGSYGESAATQAPLSGASASPSLSLYSRPSCPRSVHSQASPTATGSRPGRPVGGICCCIRRSVQIGGAYLRFGRLRPLFLLLPLRWPRLWRLRGRASPVVKIGPLQEGRRYHHPLGSAQRPRRSPRLTPSPPALQPPGTQLTALCAGRQLSSSLPEGLVRRHSAAIDHSRRH